MSKKLSLIIPSKNEVESLGAVLEEIKNNKFIDEIIVIVDNKNDNSIPIIKNYNCKLIVQENLFNSHQSAIVPLKRIIPELDKCNQDDFYRCYQ